ncbi:metallophosphoesterase [Roseobacter sp. YSTF-M11]|uniref:Metallophosphoesterase n=1 Tax=Roseobacter insulae TaxID=2859783 RepID=A0A9X1JZ09_9RHOB|nr:metallophosphoesterase family protein [Roseobacter insulae]MBW4708750.1 metallophosphoesterase [Roseobacter insulae]
MHRDLGIINDPVLLFGGPYSNLHALQALLAVATRLGIAGRQMICTGDVVAYGGAPRETVAAIRRCGATVVAGNCEKQLARRAPDCGCGFEEGSACDLLSLGWYPFADRQIDAKARAWMGACPDIVSFRHQGARYAVIHGGLTDIARFIWPNSPDAVLQAEWAEIEDEIGPVDHVVAGHCGLAFLRDTPRGSWINPGVIGLPPNDGRQQTRYGILDGGEVQIHRLSYDAEAACDAMRAGGLTQGYDTALLSGYWPSEDVLPAALRGPSLASG